MTCLRCTAIADVAVALVTRVRVGGCEIGCQGLYTSQSAFHVDNLNMSETCPGSAPGRHLALQDKTNWVIELIRHVKIECQHYCCPRATLTGPCCYSSIPRRDQHSSSMKRLNHHWHPKTRISRRSYNVGSEPSSSIHNPISSLDS